MSGCPSTMTFGTGSRELDSAFAKLFGQPDVEWPVHECIHDAGHEPPCTDGHYTWTPITITVPLRVCHD